ncbi:MAG: hypothetical protein Q9195_008290, partial [Heterodermia aff. obscurata]
MANLFYNRYIPPPTLPNKEEDNPDTDLQRPRKRPKRLQPPTAKQPPEHNPHHKLLSKYEKSKTFTSEPAASQKSSNNAPPPQQEPAQQGLLPLPQPTPTPNAPKPSISSALPPWILHPIIVPPPNPNSSFTDLDLSSPTIETLQTANFHTPLPIQSTLLPLLLPPSPPNDICVSAPTGSGKTLAYALPLVFNLRDKPVRRLRGLVIVPTRELVAQALGVVELCARGSGLRVGTGVGSRPVGEERELLVKRGQRYDIDAYLQKKGKGEVEEDEGMMDWDFDAGGVEEEELLLPGWVADYVSQVDILICTPGRLVEHIKTTKGFDLYDVQWMVIDEADRLLDESFQQWVDTVMPQLEYLPPPDALEQKLRVVRKREVRKVLLSATMTRDVSKLMALKLSRPKLVVLDNGGKEREEKDTAAAAAGEEED